jgi:hypothetical protein
MLVQSYLLVTQAAHRAGRALHAAGDPELTRSVIEDVRSELAAIEQAERGDLRGRARQAVVLTRADASPVQIAAADALLREDPFGDGRLFTDLDPTAAAVAAARWLQAAATVTAGVSGADPTGVVLQADDIEALPHATPTLVLERIADGETPRAVVLDLVAEAMEVASGTIPDPARLLGQLAEAQAGAEDLAEEHGEQIHAQVMPRLTPLDPRRPAPDLLEDLLTGIRGCWLVYREYADQSADEGVDGDSEADERTEEAARLIDERIIADFADRVRVVAQKNPDQAL